MEYLFPARKVRNVLPTFLGRHYTEDYTFRKWIHAIDKLQFSISAQCDHLLCVNRTLMQKGMRSDLVHLFEFWRNDSEPRHEFIQPRLPELIVLFLMHITTCSDFFQILSAIQKFCFPFPIFFEGTQIWLSLLNLVYDIIRSRHSWENNSISYLQVM